MRMSADVTATGGGGGIDRGVEEVGALFGLEKAKPANDDKKP